jgi:hypothetical protein
MNLAGQLILAAMFIALLLPLVGARFVNGQIAKEQTLVMTWYGAYQGSTIDRRADDWFRLWAIESGLLQRAEHALDGTTPAAPAAGSPPAHQIVVKDSAGRFGTITGNSVAGRSPKKLWHWWITAAFSLMYFAMLRLSVLVYWVPIMVPLAVAILVTGSTLRNLKQHGFGGVNPLRYRVGVRTTKFAIPFAIGGLFLPGALPPVVVPVLVLMFFGGLAAVMANRQKEA